MLKVMKRDYSLNQQIHHEINIKRVLLHVNVLTNAVREINFFRSAWSWGTELKGTGFEGACLHDFPNWKSIFL